MFRTFILGVVVVLLTSFSIAQSTSTSSSSSGQTSGASGSSGTSAPSLAPTPTQSSPGAQQPGATQAPQLTPQQMNQLQQMTPQQLQQLTPQQLNQLQQQQQQPKADEGKPKDIVTGLQDLLPEPQNEFQKMVAESTGQALPLFGYNLFQAPSTFSPVDNVPVSSDYVIGPEDELVLKVWGQAEFEQRMTVDRNGYIFLPKVGNLRVAGLKFDQLDSFLRTAISRMYHDFDMSVTMGQLRSIRVFVVGMARRPGSYTVSSLSTLVNLIFATGGPNGNGTMRHIQLRRGTTLISDFDMYDLLRKGDKSGDQKLLPGDVVYFPSAGPLVAIIGAIKTPAIYELKSETSIGGLIDIAGGKTETAGDGPMVVERIVDHKSRNVQQLKSESERMDFKLQGGDLVSLPSITARFENAVIVRGAVASPGRVPFHAGLRVAELFPDPLSLVPEKYWITKNRLTLEATVSASASVWDNVMHLTPAINWDFAIVERVNPETLETRLTGFSLKNALKDQNSPDNVVLQPGDVVTILTIDDVNIPVAKRPIYVRLEGEVAVPGVYHAEPGETLRDVVARAGGLTKDAYLFGSEFDRRSAQAEQQKRLDEIIKQMELDIESNAAAHPANTSNAGLAGTGTANATVAVNTELQEYNQNIQNQRRIVASMRAIKPNGRVVIGIRSTAKTLQDIPDIVIADNDRFSIPPQPDVVNVFGAVNVPTSFRFEKSAPLSAYVRRAGGYTKFADSGRVFVVRVDGSVVGKGGAFSGSISGLRLLPGDSVVVPQEFNKTSITKNLKDWVQILANMGIGIAAIKVLQQ